MSAPRPLRLADVEGWFAARGWRIQSFQREVWQAYRRGESGLLHAPTGTGKSLAAWFAALWSHARPGTTSPPPVTVLWVTPLRALAVDTTENLARPVEDLDLGWRVAARTGDTASAERQRQQRRLPTALVTTPESLALLLSYAGTAAQLRTHLEAVIVDEWHELLGSKRGVLLELALARLRRWRPGLRVWGLSATVGNVDEAARVLLGTRAEAAPRIVRGRVPKRHRIEAALPVEPGRLPWAGHSALTQLPQVSAAIDAARSTLVFTNTRAQAERWFDALQLAHPDWVGRIALHHGSLDPALRRQVESLLRTGFLKAVVATSSLDLGVDFSPVDQVVQIGSPKGVARLLQRAGRSGHQPGVESRVLCVPAHGLEVLEVIAARRAADRGAVESRVPLTLCLDVLAQHLVTLALADGVDPDEVFREAQSTHAFAALTTGHWQWVVDFVTRGGPALGHYPEFSRLEHDGVLLRAAPVTARRHRMAVGTISSDPMVRVAFRGGATLGMIEEHFLSRLRPGEVFQFAGRTLELITLRDMVAHVRLARGKPRVPRWTGGRMPLSNELGRAVLEVFEAISIDTLGDPEVAAIGPLLDVQRRVSQLPRPGRLLVERTATRDGTSHFFYPFAGRLVHEGLAALFAWRLSRTRALTFSFSVNDYGFELLCPQTLTLAPHDVRRLLARERLLDDVLAAVNAAEMARRQFRDIARIAGLVFAGYPGAPKTSRQLQSSSGLLFDVLARHDPDNELLHQARREVLEQQFELTRLERVLADLDAGTIVIQPTERLTPLAFPLWADRLAARLSSESWRERVERMRERLLATAPPGRNERHARAARRSADAAE